MNRTHRAVAPAARLLYCIFSLLIGVAPCCALAQGAAPQAPERAPVQADAGARAPTEAQAAANDTTTARTAQPAPAEPRALETECVLVGDIRLPFDSLLDQSAVSGVLQTSEPAAICTALREAKPVPKGADQVLSGSGDLTIAVESASLKAFREARRDQPGDLVLFLNGVALITDARQMLLETKN